MLHKSRNWISSLIHTVLNLLVLCGVSEILLNCVTGVELRICHILVFSSVLLSVTGSSRYFSAARQSWERALTACASVVFYYWYFSRSRCLHVDEELLHILRCVSICKPELIQNTSSPVCVPVYCTFLLVLTGAGGVCSLRIKQVLLCPCCWNWNGLCRLVPAVSLSLLFLASFHFNRILLVVFRKKFLARCLVHCSPAELYCCGWVSWMVRWIYWRPFKAGTN